MVCTGDIFFVATQHPGFSGRMPQTAFLVPWGCWQSRRVPLLDPPTKGENQEHFLTPESVEALWESLLLWWASGGPGAEAPFSPQACLCMPGLSEASMAFLLRAIKGSVMLPLRTGGAEGTIH